VRSVRELVADFLALLDAVPHTCPDCGKNFIDKDKLRVHQEIKEQGDFIVFRCNECGKIEQSLPLLHAHAEQHRGFWASVIDGGDPSALMEYTEKLRVTDYEHLDPSNHYGGENSE
jgi:predicted RNA-binding Zn-ribbon protein involved in translation (DUF1610 family)